jgi:DNA-directed RNA polymerase subunit RPC12/RpoP
MRREPTLEKAVAARIMKTLRGYPHVVVRKRHGTAMGFAGDPDLYGSINGRHFEIEVKRPGDPSSQPTKLQEQRLQEWAAGGAIVGVARCVVDALQILGLVRPEPRVRWTCESCCQYTWEGADAPERCPRCGHRHFDKQVVAA